MESDVSETAVGADDVRILRRLEPLSEVERADFAGTRLALVVDAETTGLDDDAEAIEVALRPISYRPADGAIIAIHPAYVGLQQPSSPVPAAITRLTGLDDETLRSKRFDLDAIEDLASAAAVCIAHSARFDRPVFERITPTFAQKPWACSIEDADWAEEGIESAKLCFVAAFVGGFFFDGHRALDDVDALIELAGREMPRSRQRVLAKILASARQGRYRLRVRAGYEHRTVLKARGYRWDPGDAVHVKNWFKDVTNQEGVDDERDAIAAATSGDARVEVVHLDALARFSRRA